MDKAFHCLREHSSIFYLLTQPQDEQLVRPKKYLGAAHEIFVVSLAVCWTVAMLVTPQKIIRHPARDATWHFNPCFGWDYPPASYIAIVLNSTNVYWTWRYAWLDATRSIMLNASEKITCVDRFARFAAYNLAIASNFWLLLWIIGPYASTWRLHTVIFLYYAVATYLAHLGNFLDARKGPLKHKIERKHQIFVVTYTIAVIFIPIVYGTIIVTDDANRDSRPVIPPAFTQTFDIVWLLHMLLEQRFSPPEPPLLMTLQVKQPEKSKQAVEPAGIEHQA